MAPYDDCVVGFWFIGVGHFSRKLGLEVCHLTDDGGGILCQRCIGVGCLKGKAPELDSVFDYRGSGIVCGLEQLNNVSHRYAIMWETMR